MENNERGDLMRISGEMTIYNAPALKKGLLDALAENRDLAMDLSEVNEMDTSGFQLLLLAKKEAVQKSRELTLVNISQAAATVIELYNMRTYFEADSSKGAAWR
ncbi:MAG: STAS domain-containing protein [Deltaproteobacteria bacterium]|nr:STAS domain-containing protein [Deltaproteobacteria bacterium]